MSKKLGKCILAYVVLSLLMVGVFSMVYSDFVCAQKKDLTIFHRWPPADFHGRVWKQMFDWFQKEHPEVNMKIDSVPASVYEVQVTVRLTGAEPPDVYCLWPGGRVEAKLRNDQIMDITDLWKREGWFKDFSKGIVEGCTHFDDKMYILPFNKMYNTFWYNMKLFQKYGFQRPFTWDELMTMGAKMKELGIYPFALGTQPTRWAAGFWLDYLMIRTLGSKFREDLMWGKESWESPEVYKVFEIWKDIAEKGYFNPDFAAIDWRESLSYLIRGEASSILMGDWTIPVCMSEDVGWVPKEDFDFFPFPIIDPNVPQACEGCDEGWVINKHAPHPDTAKTLLAWLGSREALTKYAKLFKVITPRVDVGWEVYAPETRAILKALDDACGGGYMHQNYELSTLPVMQDVGMDGFIEFLTFPDKYKEILHRLQMTAEETFGKK